jgi:N-methylhydantoinase B
MKDTKKSISKNTRRQFDPVKLEIYKNRFHSISEEMGAALQRTSFSPNIKERRDFSCAVFDGGGTMISQGDHMPAHLGAMPLSVNCVIDQLKLNRGDTAIVNDPFNGGNHLPDFTVVRPVYLPGSKSPMFYTANRAHHADVGGMSAGSMPLSREIYQEGIIIPPIKLEEDGRINEMFMKILKVNVRTPHEREGDIFAQYMAAKVGEMRLLEIVKKYGVAEVSYYMNEMQNYSERMVRTLIRSIPDGTYQFTDYMENDGITEKPYKIKVTVTINGSDAVIDFTGSDKQAAGPINCVYAITVSSVFFVFRSLVDYNIPSNYGCLVPIKIIAPERTVVNARRPAAVAAGNVETSQRIVDVLFGALAQALPGKIPAASGGTMNNLTFGGIHHVTGEPFAYYETIACGMGARPGKNGIDGIHTHMTNSLNSPIEMLESKLPIRLHKYGFRKGSGGKGRYRGGEGIEKIIEFLTDASLNLLSDRRERRPYGLQGGSPGKPGENFILRNRKKLPFPSKFGTFVEKNDILTILTPGGGGYGK